MVGIGFGPAREERLVGCGGALRLPPASAGFPRAARISAWVATYSGSSEAASSGSISAAATSDLAARECDFGAMPASGHVRWQYRFELDEDFLRTLQLAAAHRTHAPFKQQLGAWQGRYAVVGIERLGIECFGPGPLAHLRQQRRERAERVRCRGLSRASRSRSASASRNFPVAWNNAARVASICRSDPPTAIARSSSACASPNRWKRSASRARITMRRPWRDTMQRPASAAASARSWSAMRPSRSPRRNSSSDNVARSSKRTPSTRRRSRLSIEDERLASAIRPLV